MSKSDAQTQTEYNETDERVFFITKSNSNMRCSYCAKPTRKSFVCEFHSKCIIEPCKVRPRPGYLVCRKHRREITTGIRST